MEEFLLRENVQSPNKKDKVSRLVGYGTREEKLIVWRMVPWDSLWASFKADPANKSIVEHYSAKGITPVRAPPSFIAAAPWWMRKGKDEACLCLICEDLACKHRAQCLAVRRLTTIIKELTEEAGDVDEETLKLTEQVRTILSQSTKSEMCKEALKPCLTSSNLGAARGCCERGECHQCGFSNLWKRLRTKLVSTAVEASGIFVEDYHEVGVHDLWKEKMLWQGYVKRPRPVAGGTLSAGDDEEYVSSVKTARDAVLQTSEGSMVEFLDAMDIALQKHVPHRILQSQTHAAQLDLSRNRRPGCVFKNMDFSENAGPKNARLLQSDHWTCLNFTLFISIYDWVVSKEWNSTTGVIPEGGEVTVDGELAGEGINMQSYWGTVDVSGSGDSDSVVSTHTSMYIFARVCVNACA
jgi:hypothetical protein